MRPGIARRRMPVSTSTPSNATRRPLAHSPPTSEFEGHPGKKSKSSTPISDHDMKLPNGLSTDHCDSSSGASMSSTTANASGVDNVLDDIDQDSHCHGDNSFVDKSLLDCGAECTVSSTQEEEDQFSDCENFPTETNHKSFVTSGPHEFELSEMDQDSNAASHSSTGTDRVSLLPNESGSSEGTDDGFLLIGKPASLRAQGSSVSGELTNMLDDISMNSPPTVAPSSPVNEPENEEFHEDSNSVDQVYDQVIGLSRMLVPHDWNEAPQGRKEAVFVTFLINDVTYCHLSFGPSNFVLRFKTRDTIFLEKVNRSISTTVSSNTLFEVLFNSLSGEIVPEECNYTTADKGIQVYLKKREPVYWKMLSQIDQLSANRDDTRDSLEPEGSVSDRDGEEADDENSPPRSSPQPYPAKLPAPQTLVPSKGFFGGLFSKPAPVNYYGMTGINNMGNTCYLGAVVQCLANTTELRDYFLRRHWRQEVNEDNPLGTKGWFAECFEKTLEDIWCGKHDSITPDHLRNALGKLKPQFRSYSQQDAQEAMAFTIDTLHEDLNRVHKKPYLEEIPSDGRPDEEVAKATWDYHISRENSAIHDLFTGMFKSTVECPDCGKKSIKFDPYQYLSVPVPKQGVTIDCFYVGNKVQEGMVKFRMNFNTQLSFGQQWGQIQSYIGKVAFPHTRSLLVDYNYQLAAEVGRDFDCGKIRKEHSLFIYAVIPAENDCPVMVYLVQPFHRYPISPPIKRCAHCAKMDLAASKRCTICYAVFYCSKECQIKDWAKHQDTCKVTKGPPIQAPFYISSKISNLNSANLLCMTASMCQKLVHVKRQMKKSKAPATPSPSPSVESEVDLSQCPPSPSPSTTSMHDDENESEMIEWDSAQLAQDFRQSMQTRESKFPFTLVGVDRVKPWVVNSRELNKKARSLDYLNEMMKTKNMFVLLWENDKDLKVDERDLSELPTANASTTRRSCFDERCGDEVPLTDCINLLTLPETLSESDAWMCPSCKKPKEAEKTFEIWSLPTVLVFQLKRFLNPTPEIWRRDKIDTMVNYPLTDLNMSDFLVGPGDGGNYIYDLYGVVEHRGSTWFGHYTAHVRCYGVPKTSRDEVGWRFCDDESVKLDMSENVVNRDAYLLFYRRRDTVNPIHLALSNGSTSEEDEADMEEDPYNLSDRRHWNTRNEDDDDDDSRPLWGGRSYLQQNGKG